MYLGTYEEQLYVVNTDTHTHTYEWNLSTNQIMG